MDKQTKLGGTMAEAHWIFPLFTHAKKDQANKYNMDYFLNKMLASHKSNNEILMSWNYSFKLECPNKSNR